ncbi:MAG: undecaprenyl-diphosphate phosphatase [Pygmaiobacter massiliensis]|nr:undecaprenyl-diphosphate phosphatase [Pygmaiobacter massiliensis]
MTVLDGFFQGIIQGATEFLPVSSDGHLTLYQHFTGNSGEGALFFSLMLHLGTLVAVFAVYYKDIWQLILAFFGLVRDLLQGKYNPKSRDEYKRMIPMFILACLPLLGFVLVKDWVTAITEDNDIVVEGICFLYTGALLYLASKCVKGKKTAVQMRPLHAFLIGIFQGTAIMPGISRSGSTISSGLLLGYSKEYCVKFSFILGIPAILGASVLELKDALAAEQTIEWAPIVVGIITAAVVGYLCIKLIRYLVVTDKFIIFSYYTLALGALVLVIGIIEHVAGATLPVLLGG